MRTELVTHTIQQPTFGEAATWADDTAESLLKGGFEIVQLTIFEEIDYEEVIGDVFFNVEIRARKVE